jgi:conjugal transfer pilus assembly protein TraE
MKFEYFVGANTVARNAFLALAVSNGLLVIALIVVATTLSGRETQVRMIPPILSDKEMLVAETWANQAYSETWGIWVANLVGNVDLENIDETLAMLSRVKSTRLRTEMRESIRQSVENMRIQGFHLTFRTQDVNYDPNTDTVFVTGDLTEHPLRGEPETNEFTYEMRWRMDFGLPRLIHFRTYEGGPQGNR